jgi:hypothetical protein
LERGGSSSALAEGLVHDDCAGDGDVQGGDASLHRNAEEEVAGALHEVMEAGALAAEDQADILAKVKLGVIRSSALLEPDDPDVVVFELLEGAGEIGDAGDADVLGGAGGGLGNDSTEWGGTAFGEEDAGDPSAVGGAEQSAEVVGILDAIEGQEETMAGGVGWSGEEVFELKEFSFPKEGDDALVGVGAGVAGELLARFGHDAEVGGAGESQDGFEAGVAAGFALASDGDVVDGLGTGTQRLLDRVQAVKNLHRDSVWAVENLGRKVLSG